MILHRMAQVKNTSSEPEYPIGKLWGFGVENRAIVISLPAT